MIPVDLYSAGPRHVPVGRFAPSPTGRMHLGNLFSALLSWLSVRSRGGRWILRIEDLDPQRARREYAALIEEDLDWLGLDWDEGGLAQSGPHPPYMQSLSHSLYQQALESLIDTGKVYRCHCRRADLHASGAPHASDGRIVYTGRCRPDTLSRPDGRVGRGNLESPGALRLFVPDISVEFADRLFGHQAVNLATEFGDFLLQRADGAWAYQLAVVVDDARMGVSEVVRAHDLLSSSAPQIYLYRMLGLPVPEFAHVPLLCNGEGVRLSKRDASLSMEMLRRVSSPEEIVGRLAFLAGLQSSPEPRPAVSLIQDYDWSRVTPTPVIRL